jgi:hypothetical protein
MKTAVQKNTPGNVASPGSQQGIAVQAKCNCGGNSKFSGECDSCKMQKFIGFQRKLSIGAVNDVYEQEADRVADQIMAESACSDIGKAPPRIQRFKEQTSRQENSVPGSVERTLAHAGQPMEPVLRQDMEQRFARDFSRVRVHSGTSAEQSARDVSARAYTSENNIVFAAGQYAPGTSRGRRLIAHELTHVVQQGDVGQQKNMGRSQPVSKRGSDGIQRSFFGDLWEGIKSVGSAIGGAISDAAEWVGARIHDAASWVANLVRDLPARLIRLGQTIFDGLVGVVSFLPEAIQALASGGISGFASWLWEKAKAGGAWVLRLLSRIFDVLGGPELTEFVIRAISHATPLTTEERTAAQSVLGPDAIRWDEVRIANGGLLGIIFSLNGGRAFATFHTINLPSDGEHGRSNLAIVVHELTHVYQYERVGSLYLGQAIHAQATIGYGYEGAEGLRSDRASGKHFRDYNREQQAQIAQDYYDLLANGADTTAYDPFIAELRAGDL